jgi:conjugative transfer signal peptidase TraF
MVVIGIFILVLAIAVYSAGGRINTTRSIPVGLYWLTNEPVGKGRYVIFCPPQTPLFHEAKKRGYIGAGFCPGGYGYMMKRILAAKKDAVSINDEGVAVNGVFLPHSKPVKADKAGRPLRRFPLNHFTLNETETLLMSDVSDISFDGRYFGPISGSQIKSVICPVLTW